MAFFKVYPIAFSACMNNRLSRKTCDCVPLCMICNSLAGIIEIPLIHLKT